MFARITIIISLFAAVPSILQGKPADSLYRVYEKQQFYPNGKLEIAALGFATKYFGEYTDKHIGLSAGIMTRYMLPFLPEIGLGVRLTSGRLEYERRYKARFGPDFLRQFPTADFPDAMVRGTMRYTMFSAFEPALFINFFPRSSVNYYIFAGYSTMMYYPQDIDEDPIDDGGILKHYPDYHDIDRLSLHWVGGVGFDVFLSRRLALGMQCAFRYVRTDLLDGYAQIDGNGMPTNTDNFAEAGVKLSYYAFERSDSDGDGVGDEDENKYGTNPYSADTDGDGVSDYDEISFYKSNPLKLDSDNDGVSDYDEVTLYNTNPNLADTDGDGIGDYDEISLHKTNPRLPDSDDDGIGDRDEIARGTNPMNADTDGDDVPDGQDKCPLNAGMTEFHGCSAPVRNDIVVVRDTIHISRSDTVYITQIETSLPKETVTIHKGQSFTVYGINFRSGSAVIEPDSYPILDTVAVWLRQNSEIITEVRGHTDSIGSVNSNKTLSQERAAAVIEYLVDKGIERLRLSAAGYGENMPIGDNGTPEGRALNRRIEFFVKNK